MDFEIIIQEYFLDDSQPNLLKPFRSVEQSGCQGYKLKKKNQTLNGSFCLTGGQILK